MFLMTLLTMVLASDAQAGSCKKIVADTTNPFGERVHGGVVYTDRGHYTAIGLYLEKDQSQLRVMFVQRGVVDTVVPAGTVVEVVLQNGQKMSVSTLVDSEPISNASTGGVFTQWQLAGPISQEQLDAMRVSPIVGSRSKLGALDVSIVVDDKKRLKRLVALATCFQP